MGSFLSPRLASSPGAACLLVSLLCGIWGINVPGVEGQCSGQRPVLIDKLKPVQPGQVREVSELDQKHVSVSGLNTGLQGGTSVNYTGSLPQQLIHPDSFTGVYENEY